MDNDTDSIGAGQLRQSMQRAGFNDLAVTLAYRSLARKGMVEAEVISTFNDEPYSVYRVLDAGFDWLETNRDSLLLRAEGREPAPAVESAREMDVDDIPF